MDNDNKCDVRVCMGVVNGEMQYELHPRRYVQETYALLRLDFFKSDEFGKMKDAHRACEVAKRRKKAVGMLRGNDKLDAALVAGKVVELARKYQVAEGKRQAQRAVLKLQEKRRKPTVQEVDEAVAVAPEYPVFGVSMKQFRRGFCKCIKRRKGSECDCPLCTYVSLSTLQLPLSLQTLKFPVVF